MKPVTTRLFRLAAFSFLILSFQVALADYQTDTAASFAEGRIKYDRFFDDIDYTIKQFGARVHTGKIKASNAPLNEQSFLSQQSFVDLQTINIDFDDAADQDQLSLYYSHKIKDKDVRLIAGFNQYEVLDATLRGAIFGLGYYFSDESLMSFSCRGAEGDQLDYNLCSFEFRHADRHDDAPMSFRLFMNIESNYADDDIFQSGGELTFYLSRQLGVGLGIDSAFIDFSDSRESIYSELSAHSSYWFNEKIAVTGELSYAIESVDTRFSNDYDANYSQATVALQARF